MNIMFELKNVTFKHILHIRHVCLDRCVTCITGPSGSGKTTMLRLLNRLNEADGGTILFHGKDIQKMNPVELRRRVIMLGQTPVIYPGDIEENLQIGLKLSGRLPATRQKLKEYLKKVDLNKELNESCARLSGGEKQRLCLARVMLMEAEVYLVDEPSSALDKETEGFVIENLVQFVMERNRQLIMVTHSQEVSAKYPKSLLRIENGDTKGYVYE